MRVVAVVVRFLDVSLSADTGHNEEQWDGPQGAGPQGPVNVVPHLLVQKMHFLQSLDVVLVPWGVGNCPESQVMHVCHLGPGLLKADTVLEELVLILRLV